jgi:hypothetical protein
VTLMDDAALESTSLPLYRLFRIPRTLHTLITYSKCTRQLEC